MSVDFKIVIETREATRSLNNINNAVDSTVKRFKDAGEDIGTALDRITDGIKAQAAALAAGWSVKEFVSKVATVRGEFQKLEIAFNTMLGNKAKAEALMNQLIKTAATTPFDLQGVAQGAKQLLAYGIQAEDVNNTLVRLGDIAAGLSIPLNDLVWLYGTTMTQGRLFARDLYQFMGRGIPLTDELAKQFGVTKDKVMELVSAGKVGAEEVKKAIESMTDEGGKFGGLMEEQSKTITGQIANIEDAVEVMFNNIGKSQEGVINTALSGISYLVENYREVGRQVIALVGAYGVYKAAIITLSALEKAHASYLAMSAAAARVNAIAHTNLSVTAFAAAKAQKALNASILANPYVVAGVAVAGLAVAVYEHFTAATAAEKA